MKSLKCNGWLLIVIVMLVTGVVVAQPTEQTKQRTVKRKSASVATAARSASLEGSGTYEHLAKWGPTSNLENSSVTEDKYGNLTIMGTIKFPNGTVQGTAGLSSVATDSTLTGAGTPASPLRLNLPATLAAKGSEGGSGPVVYVKNLDTFGEGIGIQGQGGSGSDLAGGPGLWGIGGDSSLEGGEGVRASAGDSDTGSGGVGLRADGGLSTSGTGGDGVDAAGGPSSSGTGGIGLSATGGYTDTKATTAGDGIMAAGGGALEEGSAGNGLVATGGEADAIGGQAGDGLVVNAGIGQFGSANGIAGTFNGDVMINGSLNVSGTKNFKIDDPLNPKNDYLIHAAIESSEVLDLYSGNVVTDGSGVAIVQLPKWFGAINSDFRYQLTVIGSFAQAIVASEIKNNQFTIQTSAPNVKVSRLVTGVRSDPEMVLHPFQPVQPKPARERGYYVNPDAYGQPGNRGIEWARHPVLMKRLQKMRQQAEQRAAAGR